MLVVTGGAGFIGGTLVRSWSRQGHDVVVVDDLDDPTRVAAWHGAKVADVIAPDVFLDAVADGSGVRRGGRLRGVEAVVHQGAISSTTHPDGRELLDRNSEYTRRLLDACAEQRLPLVYASSAAVYGRSDSFAEDPANESPLNLYGWTKLLVDQEVRRRLATLRTPVVGLRYFNVYGPGEGHKGPMASMVHQVREQLATSARARLFGASHERGPGEQQRDFVHVDDVVDVVSWFVDHPVSGIYNVGTGSARSFNDLAAAVRRHVPGDVEYIEMPSALAAAYQPRTEADLTALRAVGYDREFTDLDTGVDRFIAATTAPATGLV